MIFVFSDMGLLFLYALLMLAYDFSIQIVALKFISKTKKPEKEVNSLRREIDIMRSLRHPNIVEMLDSFDTANEVVVVTEFAQGELFQILQDDRTLPEDQVLVCCSFFMLVEGRGIILVLF